MAASYTVVRTDAAGNDSTLDAGSTFAVTINYQACDQARAFSRNTTASHNPFAAGTANCTGCHSLALATGFVAAPPPPPTTATGIRQYYWCRKS